METKEYSEISASGITLVSTPIRTRESSAEYVTVNETTAKQDPTEVSTTEEEELDSIVNTHPELKVAGKENGKLNPVNVAYTMFSPMKQKNSEEVVIEYSEPEKQKSPSPVPPSYNIFLDPMTPYTLTLYFQLFFNVIVMAILLYAVYITYSTLKADINFKIQSYTLELLDEISQCLKQYLLNKCDSPNRPPAIEAECNLLEKCQNQDPTLISRSKITSEILAEIINSFFNKISYKSISIVVLFGTGCIFLNYYVIGNFQAHEINKLRDLEQTVKEQEEVITRLRTTENNIDNLEEILAP
ncbi:Nucleus export protein brr6 [Candida viswanathii]|uniref:Nucleus export protein brr6 n=1 Tax=Candida viswanathii TaxID=5486 RepID=A0A367XUX4_9ASCO|nr:Nucleus export protein brr6 [Candida viswanathii]